jgi:imidazolonepropionase-like amidohydrolase
LGSDAGSAVAHGSNFGEVFALVELGFPADEVLRAATVVGADILGKSSELGQIEVGYIADIVAYQKNPLDDIETLSKPVLVVKEGAVVFDSRDGT